MCDSCGCGQSAASEQGGRIVQIKRRIRQANDQQAQHNREHLLSQGSKALNLVSSPGAGKTTLLEHTLKELAATRSVAVIEGDLQTDNDARRIAASGSPVVQINTGSGCHLDAALVHQALHDLEPKPETLLFIENVGNLICPAGFDLGQSADVVLLSVTEGEDKPQKYPQAFASAQCMLLTKIDLLPHLDFDVDGCRRYARTLNPDLPILELSARTGQGMDAWFNWLAEFQKT